MDPVSEFGLFDSGHNPVVDLGLSQVRCFPERKGDIFIDGHRIEKGVVLEHVADLGQLSGLFFLGHPVEGLTPEENGPFIGLDQPDEVFEEHALTGSAEADDRGYFSLINLQVYPIKDRSGIEAFADVFKFN